MEKQQRHLAIKHLLADHAITTQTELASLLRKAGFKTTQATLSRDMQEIGIAWVHTPNGSRYMLSPDQEEERLTMLIGLEIEKIESNETMIVIKTLPGRAQGVAESIDHLQLPSVLGTIAGDNTIFVLPRYVKKIHETVKAIKDILQKTKLG
ncbi:MAG TPA: arginine repressor [Bacteroidota bacterium]|nr:arginine repressor [Bacteroidota bacterium]